MNKISAQSRLSYFRLQLWPELAVHSLLLMETAWVSSWYQALHGFREDWLMDFVILGGFFFAAYWLSRLLSGWRLKRYWQRIFFFAWLVIAIAISSKLLLYPATNLSIWQLLERPFQAIFTNAARQGEFWHLLIFLVLGLRAIHIARSPLDQRELLTGFQIGLFALMVFGVAYSLSIHALSLGPLFLFLFFGLMALACGRISQISELRGGRLPGIQPLWGGGIALVVLVLILITLVSGWIFEFALADAVAFLIYLLFAVLMTIFLLLISPFLFLVNFLVQWLQERFTSPEAQETFDLVSQLYNRLNQADEHLKNVVALIERIEPFLLVGILGLILVAAILWLGWRPLKQVLLGEQEVQNLPASPLKLATPHLPGTRRPAFHRSGQLLAAMRIRQIYARLLALSARLGLVRSPACTPIEFLPALVALFPEHKIELESITQAYLRVRYGLLPESEAEVQTIMDAWQRVNQAGRKKIASQKRQARLSQ
jgi:hypothetical protein